MIIKQERINMSNQLALTQCWSIAPTAIDQPDTRIREDAFSFERCWDGTSVLKVMVVIPDFSKLIPGNVDMTIADPWHNMRLFQNNDLRNTSFYLNKERKALIATFRLSKDYKLLEESLAIGKVTLQNKHSFDGHDKRFDFYFWEAKTALLSILKTRETIYRKLKYIENNDTVINFGPSSSFIFGTTSLFNQTCRRFARSNNIPFIAFANNQRNPRYQVSMGFAHYNKPLRNPCSLINLLNLVSYLSGDIQRQVSEDELISLLNKLRLPFTVKIST